MNKRHFLMLMIIMIVGLFSIAYAETVAIVTEAEKNFSETKIEDITVTKIIGSTKAVSVALAPSAVPDPPVVIHAAHAAAVAAPIIQKTLPRKGELIDWWKGGNEALPIGQQVTVVDVKTGKSFKAMRTYGHNHADMETLTNEDAMKMKEIFGGSWNWERRPVVVISNGKAIAASCAGMPHAGLDNAPAESTVSNRSDGFGRGVNLDRIKNNGMDGVFDIHLLNSKTHCSNREDARHQASIRVAAGL